MAVILKGLNDTVAQLAKASETQTATLTSLKEDILLRSDSDEEAEDEDSYTSKLNISAMLNNVLDPSDSGVVKKSACSDSAGRNMSIISIVDKSRSLSIKFDTNQSTNIGCR